jgi:hypothetical protein
VGGGGQSETNGGPGAMKYIYIFLNTYVFSCHSANAIYSFGHNHRKQYTKSSNEALKRTVYHTDVWLKLRICNTYSMEQSPS